MKGITNIPFFTSLSFTHWSLTSPNGKESSSSLIVNSHHSVHTIYSFSKGTFFAIIALKEPKTEHQVKTIYGQSITVEPILNTNRLGTFTDEEVFELNRNFMKNNFDITVEIN
jgi:hypothetical protein